ncbi:hypothetical protein DCAR_0726708 [Daucus carota subsp. sativus]|uniref:Uncharacterized protein n=1 Tax=Daucus carota subsp. sativus TaxID=79200 RepID=A0A161WPE4_DAUCS|nr:hypothetical protein DCAR_0726708 [Daucus carota subsp. sativus]
MALVKSPPCSIPEPHFRIPNSSSPRIISSPHFHFLPSLKNTQQIDINKRENCIYKYQLEALNHLDMLLFH